MVDFLNSSVIVFVGDHCIIYDDDNDLINESEEAEFTPNRYFNLIKLMHNNNFEMNVCNNQDKLYSIESNIYFFDNKMDVYENNDHGENPTNIDMFNKEYNKLCNVVGGAGNTDTDKTHVRQPNVIEQILEMHDTDEKQCIIQRVGDVKGTTPISQIVPTKVRFLTVEYSHPNINMSIELFVPDEYYMVGNHLFTPTFVYYLLEQHMKKTNTQNTILFDKNYSLTLVDNQADISELDSSCYIVLQNSTFQRVKVE
jgi:hypothetical protein